ncbi:MAG: hypothetical protein CVU32_02805 [Betaproteobacteria bacterium HGW-Betaproteobacteria-5]|nr:MAG: hypothetical protein CVU32_02805 [Betaproteobacteria bacterium HGW-Betaproteobacteria-5]PKO37616.1 MAG: hypothetical protein CVU33_12180 [Betaproteobacteria bacterium HGW-Betaproteobacteria-6]
MTVKKNAHRLTILAASCLALGANAAEDLLSRDDLFGDDLPTASTVTKSTSPSIKGFVQFEAARTTGNPEHWSKLRTRAELGSNGKLGEGLKWKLGARLDYDAAYSINDYYPADVEKNQRYNIELRENYLDVSAGNWDFRFGKQHVVWGEMVGLFFADVVSARDLREFILPEFDQMRVPQWAARAEYFADDYHAELLWIPVASYDNIGKPGADFYPYQPVPTGFSVRYLPEQRPERNADHMNYGLRLSTLKNGWDISGFYYRSSDITPTFYRQFEAPTTFIYQARHDRIDQYGGTVSKDFGEVVFKAETVYTRGRSFTSLNFADTDGVVRQNTLDWAAGLDFTLPAETRLNVQIFQRQFHNYDANIIPDQHENGYSVLLNNKLFANWEAQALFISSLNRTDWLFRPRITWNFEQNWRWILGADVFHGPQLGMFGQYDSMDRVYSEIRHSF